MKKSKIIFWSQTVNKIVYITGKIVKKIAFNPKPVKNATYSHDETVENCQLQSFSCLGGVFT